MAVTADLKANTLYGISPLSFAQSIVDEIEEGDSTGAIEASEDSLLTSGDNRRVVGGLRAAWTASPWLGFHGFVESGLGNKFNEEEDDDEVVVNGGASASIDLNPICNVAVGIGLSGRYESLNERGDDLGGDTKSFGLGIYYTGRRDFTVGLDTTWATISRRAVDGDIDAFQSRFVLRYDFN